MLHFCTGDSCKFNTCGRSYGLSVSDERIQLKHIIVIHYIILYICEVLIISKFNALVTKIR